MAAAEGVVDLEVVDLVVVAVEGQEVEAVVDLGVEVVVMEEAAVDQAAEVVAAAVAAAVVV